MPTLKISDIKNKCYSLHPNEHKKVKIKNNNVFKISEIVDFDDVGNQIDVSNYLNLDSNYYLGTISCMSDLLFNVKQGESIRPIDFKNSSKKIKKNDLIISRNATLGKVSIVNDDINAILNGGLSYLRIKYRLT